ncbi:MAG TPA: lytic transglycosylase domain-containing protein, partial [Myxococcota bacterium]|nr:lytic transglycosylase domain-containing protein [Myxococcota bacterium]
PTTGDGLLADRRLWPDLTDAQFRELSRDVTASLYRPEVALRVGLAVLAERIEARRGNLTLALADYNAGLVAVNRAGGVPRIQETQDYVRLVPQYRRQVAEAAGRIIG